MKICPASVAGGYSYSGPGSASPTQMVRISRLCDITPPQAARESLPSKKSLSTLFFSPHPSYFTPPRFSCSVTEPIASLVWDQIFICLSDKRGSSDLMCFKWQLMATTGAALSPATLPVGCQWEIPPDPAWGMRTLICVRAVSLSVISYLFHHASDGRARSLPRAPTGTHSLWQKTKPGDHIRLGLLSRPSRCPYSVL